jgi:hypothetical protein
MKVQKPKEYTKIEGKKGCGRPLSPFAAAIEALKVGQAVEIDFEENVRTTRVYPVVSRMAKKLGRRYVCRRLDETKFTFYRTA